MAGNFGIGIGFSAQPNTYANIAQANQQYSRNKKAKQEEDDENTWRKYLDAVKVTGVHRLDADEANKNAAMAIQKLSTIYKEKPLTWKNEAPAILNEWALSQQKMMSRNKVLQDQLTEYDKIKSSKDGYTTPAQDAWAEAVKSKDWAAVSQIQDDIGSVSYNSQDHGTSLNFVPQINTNAIDKAALNDPRLYSDVSTIKGQSLADGRTSFLTIKGMPDTRAASDALGQKLGTHVFSLEDVANDLLNDPAYYSRTVAEQVQKNQIPNFKALKDAAEKDPVAAEQLHAIVVANKFEQLKKQAGALVSSEIMNPVKAAKNKSEDSKNKTLDEMVASGDVSDKYEFNLSDNKRAEGRYAMSISTSSPTTLPNAIDVIDLANKKKVLEQKQFQFFPKLIINKLGKDGRWRAWVTGEAYDSDTKLTLQADPKNPGGDPIMLPDPNGPPLKKIADIQVPLKKVASALNAKKIQTQWAVEAEDRLNNQETKPDNKQDGKAEDLRKKYEY